MRRETYSNAGSWAFRLIFINVGVYLLQGIMETNSPNFIIYWFGLIPHSVIYKYYLWQPFTYMFLHGGFFHIFFNMYALLLFGLPVEQLWGGRRFLLYF